MQFCIANKNGCFPCLVLQSSQARARVKHIANGMSTWCPHTAHGSCSITMAKLFQMLFTNYNTYFFIENAAERSTAREASKSERVTHHCRVLRATSVTILVDVNNTGVLYTAN